MPLTSWLFVCSFFWLPFSTVAFALGFWLGRRSARKRALKAREHDGAAAG